MQEKQSPMPSRSEFSAYSHEAVRHPTSKPKTGVLPHVLTYYSSRLNEVTQELSALQKKLAEKSAAEAGQNSTAPSGDASPQNGETSLDDEFYFMASLEGLPHPTTYLGDVEIKPNQVVALFEQ